MSGEGPEPLPFEYLLFNEGRKRPGGGGNPGPLASVKGNAGLLAQRLEDLCQRAKPGEGCLQHIGAYESREP